MTVIGLSASLLPRSTRENTTSAFQKLASPHRCFALEIPWHSPLGELLAERARHDITVAHHLTYVTGKPEEGDRVDPQILSLLPRKVRGAGDYDGNLAA